MKEIYERAQNILQRGGTLALATIVASRGSTPREVGAKMIIEERGQIMGTVGGGCGEAQVWQDALRVLKEGRPRFSTVDLTGEINENTATNCGGIMDVFVDFLRPGQPAFGGAAPEDVVQHVLDIYNRRQPAVLVTVLENSGAGPIQPGCKVVITEGGEVLGWPVGAKRFPPEIVEQALAALGQGRSRRVKTPNSENAAALDVFYEVLLPPAEIVIVGAGHIAQPLAQIARVMNFEVTVIDDRANFANKSRFPQADRIIVDDVERAVGQLAIGPATHIVLVTRGHQMDQAALLRVIGSRAAYIGMIGSKRRVNAVFTYLREKGIADDLIDRVYAPIGLDIGAETPDEIAVAIMAEIIKIRRKGRSASLAENRRRKRE
ncbi:MAG TPA: XdhC family protein [Blastocatellia bacterium]|nr:XdhC family protein [Blastocatellia bacterium]